MILIAASAAVLAFAVQQGLAPAFTKHAGILKDAAGLKATLAVNVIGGGTAMYNFTFGKPGLLRIDGPDQLVVSDGKTLTVLDKKTNSYTQSEAGDTTAIDQTSSEPVWAWASFFQTDPAKLVKTAVQTGQRSLRGVKVDMVDVLMADGKTTATVYVDVKSGIVRGISTKLKGQDAIIWADNIQTEGTAPDASEFTFTAPAGATKVEAGSTSDPTWSTVSAIFNSKCMPCHSAERHSGQLDLTSYDSVSSSRYVVKGESSNSILIRVLSAAGRGRMPQGRAELPESEKQTIAAWIDGGLRQ
ncbi:MAG TPA: DUF2092 domain-containing protein [Fimbriimonadaceae bacterium]|nr:DUF2092 domain-containing protein [Fimbriimonadaceae bacterium]